MADQPVSGVPVDDNRTYLWLPAKGANIAAPTLAEINATSAVDISCALTDIPGESVDPSKYERIRVCTSRTTEKTGAAKFKLGELKYVFDPQADAATPGEYKAAAALTPGASGWLVVRKGIAYGTPFAAGQHVTIWDLTLGQRVDIAERTNADFTYSQDVSVNNFVQDAEIVAA